MNRTATISACGFYRYRLDREWDRGLGNLYAGLINPSTADAYEDDATVRGLVARAKKLGFGSLTIWNAFAVRSSNPADIYQHTDPVGPLNNHFIKEILEECKSGDAACFVGWSHHGNHLGRADKIVSLAKEVGVPLYCVGVNADGSPRHPLYVRHDAVLTLWA